MTGEQVAASLATASQRALGVLQGLPVKTVHNVLCGVLALWLLYQLVTLVMVLVPSSSPEPVSTEAPAAASASSQANNTGGNAKVVQIGELQALNLFGKAGAEPIPAAAAAPVVIEEEAINAAKTKLNLALEGIVFTPQAAESVAVIVFQGRQEQYRIGDKLPAGNQVVLSRVLMDHVILDNSGRYESLWLYDDDKNKRSTRSRPRRAPRQVTDIRDDDDATDLAQGYRQRLYSNPASLAEVIRISPAQKDGQMVGYRVSPGKDRKQFAQLGFKANDIVTSINDIELDEPSKALAIYKLMRTAKEASFTVQRNGQAVQIMVSLDDTQ